MKFKNDVIVFCVFCVIFIAVSIGVSTMIGGSILDEQFFWNRIDNNLPDNSNYSISYNMILWELFIGLIWLSVIITITESKIKPIKRIHFFIYSCLATSIIVPITILFFNVVDFSLILLPMILLAIKSSYQNPKPSFIDAFLAVMSSNFGIALYLGLFFTLPIGLHSFAYLTVVTTLGLSFIWLLCLFYNFLSPKEKEKEPEAT